jgi:hypothetical protein
MNERRPSERPSVSVNAGIGGGVLLAFILIAWFGGVERIDCALKIEKACVRVAERYEPKK